MNTFEGKRKEIKASLPDGAFDDLLEYENVYSVGIGFEEVDGERTGEVTLTFSVDPKQPEVQLGESEVIPEEIHGVRTDVIDREGLKEELLGDRDEVVRPVIGGISGNGGSSGTIGGVFEDSDGTPLALTNRHVACDSDEDCTGDTFYQPDEMYGDEEPIGEISQIGQWSEEDGDEDTNLDAALVELDEDAASQMVGMGRIGTPEDPELGETYVAGGSRTGYVTGECVETDVALAVNHSGVGSRSYRDCVYFSRETTTSDDWQGNSGSLQGRFDREGTFHPVALHFAGSDQSAGMPFRKVNEELETLHSTDGEPATEGTSEPEIEAAFIRKANHPSGLSLSFLVTNTGGGSSEGTFALMDSEGSTLDMTQATVESNGHRVIQFEIDPEHSEDTVYVVAPSGPEHEVHLNEIEAGASFSDATNISRKTVSVDDESTIQTLRAGYEGSEYAVWGDSDDPEPVFESYNLPEFDGRHEASLSSDPAGGDRDVLEIFYPEGDFRGLNGRHYLDDIVGYWPNELHARFDLYVPTGFQWANAGYGGTKFPGPGNQSNSCGYGGNYCSGEGFTARTFNPRPGHSWDHSGGDACPYAVYVYDDTASTTHHDGWYRGGPNLGEWFTVDMFISMNDVDVANGVIKGWINGTPAFEKDSYLFFDSDHEDDMGVEQWRTHFYFGGTWGSPTDQSVYHRDLKLWVDDLPEMP